ncbi:hypothetical protein JST97_05960 [bacterium]|nr:hypothetical protein [bacterium]
MRNKLHWASQPLDQLAAVTSPWRIVSALPWFEQMPGLRQQTLGKRAVLALPEAGQPLLVLRLPRRIAALDGQRFAGERLGFSNAWVLALQAGPGESCPETPSLPSGPARLDWAEGWPEVRWGQSRLGSGCHPLARDWAWAWTPTYGPVLLRLYLQASQAAIISWVESQCAGLWRAHPSGNLASRLSEDCRMLCSPGYLRLSRGYLHPPEEQVEADYFLLMNLTEGALGELEFDLMDGDYVRYVATGDSRQSLRDYLHARAGRGRPHRWNRFRDLPVIDAVASDPEGCAALVSQALGWEPLSLEPLLTRLAATPLSQLPRHLHIEVRSEVWGQEVWDRFARAQPRILFTWRHPQASP